MRELEGFVSCSGDDNNNPLERAIRETFASKDDISDKERDKILSDIETQMEKLSSLFSDSGMEKFEDKKSISTTNIVVGSVIVISVLYLVFYLTNKK